MRNDLMGNPSGSPNGKWQVRWGIRRVSSEIFPMFAGFARCQLSVTQTEGYPRLKGYRCRIDGKIDQFQNGGYVTNLMGVNNKLIINYR